MKKLLSLAVAVVMLAAFCLPVIPQNVSLLDGIPGGVINDATTVPIPPEVDLLDHSTVHIRVKGTSDVQPSLSEENPMDACLRFYLTDEADAQRVTDVAVVPVIDGQFDATVSMQIDYENIQGHDRPTVLMIKGSAFDVPPTNTHFEILEFVDETEGMTLVPQFFIQDRVAWSWIGAGDEEACKTRMGETNHVNFTDFSGFKGLDTSAGISFGFQIYDSSLNTDTIGDSARVGFSISDLTLKAEGYDDLVVPIAEENAFRELTVQKVDWGIAGREWDYNDMLRSAIYNHLHLVDDYESNEDDLAVYAYLTSLTSVSCDLTYNSHEFLAHAIPGKDSDGWFECEFVENEYDSNLINLVTSEDIGIDPTWDEAFPDITPMVEKTAPLANSFRLLVKVHADKVAPVKDGAVPTVELHWDSRENDNNMAQAGFDANNDAYLDVYVPAGAQTVVLNPYAFAPSLGTVHFDVTVTVFPTTETAHVAPEGDESFSVFMSSQNTYDWSDWTQIANLDNSYLYLNRSMDYNFTNFAQNIPAFGAEQTGDWTYYPAVNITVQSAGFCRCPWDGTLLEAARISFATVSNSDIVIKANGYRDVVIPAGSKQTRIHGVWTGGTFPNGYDADIGYDYYLTDAIVGQLNLSVEDYCTKYLPNITSVDFSLSFDDLYYTSEHYHWVNPNREGTEINVHTHSALCDCNEWFTEQHDFDPEGHCYACGASKPDHDFRDNAHYFCVNGEPAYHMVDCLTCQENGIFEPSFIDRHAPSADDPSVCMYCHGEMGGEHHFELRYKGCYNHYYACSYEDGADYSEPHVFCDGVCLICGMERHEPVSSTGWQPNDGWPIVHVMYCDICYGSIEAPHNYDESGRCIDCGYQVPEGECAHHFILQRSDETSHFMWCDKCNSAGFGSIHNFGPDGICEVCGVKGAKKYIIDTLGEGGAPVCNHRNTHIEQTDSDDVHLVVCTDCGDILRVEKHNVPDGETNCTGCGAKVFSRFDINHDGKVSIQDAIDLLKRAMNVD